MTNGYDVIRWSLDHAFRLNYGDVQAMKVEIGAPQRNADNSIVAATGVNDAIDSKIIDNTKATYTSGGYTGNNGYAGDFTYLKLNKNDHTTARPPFRAKWHAASRRALT